MLWNVIREFHRIVVISVHPVMRMMTFPGDDIQWEEEEENVLYLL